MGSSGGSRPWAKGGGGEEGPGEGKVLEGVKHAILD